MQRHVFMLAGLACGLGACEIAIDDGVDTVVRSEFVLRVENVAPWTALKSGVQAKNTSGGIGALGPGESFEVSFTAGAEQSITFATMLGESNDWFFAPGPEGIPLYTGGRPTSGDVTRYVRLWDAGTELDQEPGVGNATGTRQPVANFGTRDLNTTVREVGRVTTLANGSTFTRPEVTRMIRVTLVAGDDRRFTLRIANVSTTGTLVTSIGTLSVHLSAMAWSVHVAPAPLFEIGGADRKLGLENLAEDGSVDRLGTSLRALTGYPTALSPGVAVVHQLPGPLFTLGQPDPGKGLERIAEDGDNRELSFNLDAEIGPDSPVLEAVSFDGPVDGTIGVAAPGSAYEVLLSGEPGDMVSFATMFGFSNDWYFATQPQGVPLFNGLVPINGEITNEIRLYDLGSELDQELAVGTNTGPQQRGPNIGPADSVSIVREVTIDRYPFAISKHLRVTLTPYAPGTAP